MLTTMMSMMTMMILVGEGKRCTRHLTNSLSTQPDDDVHRRLEAALRFGFTPKTFCRLLTAIKILMHDLGF